MMKIKHLRPFAFSLTCVAAIVTGWAADAPDPASAVPDLGPGVVYRHVVDKAIPLSIHVLEVERGRPDLLIMGSVGQALKGKESVPKMAAALVGRGKPIAAINGGFFEISKQPLFYGVTSGLSILDGELVRGPKTTSLCFDAAGNPSIRKVPAKFRVVWPDGSETPFGLNSPTSDYESSVRSSDVVLFTPRFGSATSPTNAVRELVLGPADGSPWLPLRAGREYEARVLEIRTKGTAPIAPDTMVLSIARKADAATPAVRVGDKLSIGTAFEQDMADVFTAVSGEPQLLQAGQEPPQPPVKPGARAPRTFVGYNATRLFFVVVDGRQEGLSAGMSFEEGAVFMHGLGCEEAIALDGGGSSTFWLDGRVMNSPSDGQPRAVADCLIVVRRP
jgi:exopolysaccharide biosynthesis protein